MTALCNMCASRRDKPAYTSTCASCRVEHCDHMRCHCRAGCLSKAPVLLKSRKEAPVFQVALRCPCGADMAPTNVAGETSVSGRRSCTCGIAVAFELRLDGWSVAGRPLYSLLSCTLAG